jgi:hypothetical protein
LLLFRTDANMPTVYLLDYVAGNVRSLVNAIEKVGYTVEWVRSPADVPAADVRDLLQLLKSPIDTR